MQDQEIVEQPEIEIGENQEPLPQLYSKYVIIGFCVFFSTIFGAVLLMSNLKQVKNTRGRTQVIIFAICYTIFSIFLINYFMANFAVILNVVGAAILNEYFWNKFIGQEQEYEKKKWSRAFGISVLIVLPLVLLALNYGI